MDFIRRKEELAEEFYPSVKSFGNKTKLWIVFLVLVILVGMFGPYKQITEGHLVTGMRDNVVWGVYIINFIFFVTISYSEPFISGVLHFFNTPWSSFQNNRNSDHVIIDRNLIFILL
ncbi:MAG: hypothetical protein R2771_11345 [Saprospiraceae bacterium]